MIVLTIAELIEMRLLNAVFDSFREAYLVTLPPNQYLDLAMERIDEAIEQTRSLNHEKMTAILNHLRSLCVLSKAFNDKYAAICQLAGVTSADMVKDHESMPEPEEGQEDQREEVKKLLDLFQQFQTEEKKDEPAN